MSDVVRKKCCLCGLSDCSGTPAVRSLVDSVGCGELYTHVPRPKVPCQQRAGGACPHGLSPASAQEHSEGGCSPHPLSYQAPLFRDKVVSKGA